MAFRISALLLNKICVVFLGLVVHPNWKIGLSNNLCPLKPPRFNLPQKLRFFVGAAEPCEETYGTPEFWR